MTPNTAKISFPFRYKLAVWLEHPAIQRVLLLIILLQIASLVVASVAASTFEHYEKWMGIAALFTYLYGFELALRLFSQREKFFGSFWNICDACIILAALYPPFIMVSILRILRVLRGLQLIQAPESAQLLYTSLKRCIPTFFTVSITLYVVYFTYALLAFHLFSVINPEHYGSFDSTMYTTLIILGDGWNTEIADPIFAEVDFAGLYFGSFYVITRLIIWFIPLSIFASILHSNRQNISEDTARETQAVIRELKK